MSSKEEFTHTWCSKKGLKCVCQKQLEEIIENGEAFHHKPAALRELYTVFKKVKQTVFRNHLNSAKAAHEKKSTDTVENRPMDESVEDGTEDTENQEENGDDLGESAELSAGTGRKRKDRGDDGKIISSKIDSKYNFVLKAMWKHPKTSEVFIDMFVLLPSDITKIRSIPSSYYLLARILKFLWFGQNLFQMQKF